MRDNAYHKLQGRQKGQPFNRRLAALALACLTSAAAVFPAAGANPGPGGGTPSVTTGQGPGGSPTAAAPDNSQSPSSGSSKSGFTMSPNAYKKVDGVYRMADGATTIPDVRMRGIDVSHWKQAIDWNAVAADDIQFAMLGTRYKMAVDPYFHKNAREASAAGLKLGAYIYSYAQNVDEAVAEADFVLDLIKDYPISMPIAFDMEDTSQQSMSKQQLADLANAFCGRIAAAGYYPIIYANDYWLANHLDMSLMRYDVWVARYGAKPVYSGYAMWQATSSGSVNGVNGSVDINFMFKDYPSVLPANLWRNVAGRWYYYQDYAKQANGWIHDGSAWYHLDESGQYQTGWIEDGGRKYFLEDSGAMATGWRQTDNGWIYFKPSGYMATGWVQDGDTWYYLNGEGVMQTGWQQLDGSHYYLKGSGAMAIGWVQDSGSWYYMDGSGRMATGWVQDNGGWFYLKPSGRMATGWVQDNGSWHYMDGSGRMATGIVEVDGKRYYLSPEDGRMAANTEIQMDGVTYTVDGNGVCTPKAEGADGGSQPGSSPSDGVPGPTDESGGQPGGSTDGPVEGPADPGQATGASNGPGGDAVTVISP